MAPFIVSFAAMAFCVAAILTFVRVVDHMWHQGE
jgi:hypothetical protein